MDCCFHDLTDEFWHYLLLVSRHYVIDETLTCFGFVLLYSNSFSITILLTDPTSYKSTHFIFWDERLDIFYLKKVCQILKLRMWMNCFIFVKIFNVLFCIFYNFFLSFERIKLCVPKTFANILNRLKDFKYFFCDFLLMN